MTETTGSSRNRTSGSCRHSQSDRKIIPASSLFLKHVILHDWWLVQNQNKQISVAGFASTERSGERLFFSEPISRRINTITLETLDGIIITISGLVNRSQMLQNGFSFLVCNNFDLGFPYDWEECIAQYNDEESAKRRVSTEKSCNSSFSDTKTRFSLSLFDNLPATKVRGLVLHMSACSESSCDHIMGKVASNESQHSQEAAKFEEDETMRNRKRGKADQIYNNNNNDDDDDDATILDANNMETEVVNQSRGVITRSRQSSKNLGSKENNVTLKSSVKSKNLRNKAAKEISGDFSARLSMREADKNDSPKFDCAPKVSSKEDTELTEATDLSSVRRSGRLKIQKSYLGMAG